MIFLVAFLLAFSIVNDIPPRAIWSYNSDFSIIYHLSEVVNEF